MNMTARSLATTNSTATKYDPFDPANIRLDQDFLKMSGAKKLLTTVPVRRPNKQDYVRVHASEDYRMTVLLIEFKEENDVYMVGAEMKEALAGEYFGATLYTAINRQGVVFLWPVRLPDTNGKIMDWHRTAHEAAAHAMHHWVRVVANKSLGAYETIEGPASIPDPDWSNLPPYKELQRIGFRHDVVDRLDHPVVKRLQGR
jgi:hypothetical protein